MQITDTIWNSEPEVGQFLAALIKMHKVQTVLEVGVFEGKTSLPIIEALPKDGLYHGIDVEDLRTVFSKRKDIVNDFILGSSLDILPTLNHSHYDLIFVDSMHYWDHIMPEFKFVEPLLAKGGIIAYHDSIHIVDVDRLMKYAKSWGYSIVTINTPEDRGLTLLQRTK